MRRAPLLLDVVASLGLLALLGLGSACEDRPAPVPVEAAAPSPHPEIAPPLPPPLPSAEADPEAAAIELQRSMALEGQGLLDQAAEAADAALRAGGGRAVRLQAAKVAILRERYDDAEALLRPLLQADPHDADALYDLGLVAHRRGRYNDARSSYLAALRAREDYPDARYNLAVLTWNRNVQEEARHHVARFIARWPDDPRATELAALVGAPAPGQTSQSPKP